MHSLLHYKVCISIRFFFLLSVLMWYFSDSLTEVPWSERTGTEGVSLTIKWHSARMVASTSTETLQNDTNPLCVDDPGQINFTVLM